MAGVDVSTHGDCLLGSRIYPASLPSQSHLHLSHLYAHPHTRSAPHSRSLTLRPHFSGAIAPVTMVVAMELGIANPVPALNCLVQPSIAWAGE
jgi:hypothetical protein